MIFFFDACAVIYWVESKNPFYQKLLQGLKSIHDQYPEGSIAISRISVLECRVRPLMEKNKANLDLYEDFFSMDDLKIVELTPEVIDLATDFRVKYLLKTPDALQAASAASLKEETIFITGDTLFKKVHELNLKLI